MKPGGHGVILKLARDAKIFTWLFSFRQSKGPRAADQQSDRRDRLRPLRLYGDRVLLRKSVQGFGSCPRHLKAAEGMNILKRENGKDVLTNVEYCHFQKVSIKENEKFPANTNLLFVDLQAADRAAAEHPIPSVLVNVKKIHFYNEKHELCEEEVVRLEFDHAKFSRLFPRR